MEWIIKGSILKYGDNIDTDQIYPGRYLELTDHKDIAGHAMEGADPIFLQRLKNSPIIVAGKNFGCGSSREHAVITLVHAGVKAVIAESFARIFYRNAINLGLPAVICPGIYQIAKEGSLVEVDLASGHLRFLNQDYQIKIQKMPPYIRDILTRGGLISYLRSKKHE